MSMALFAIGDTHLSLGANKPMDVFGGGWEGYVDKLAAGLVASSQPEDTVVHRRGHLLGHESGGGRGRILPSWTPCRGRKLLLKGNHDYWWNTAVQNEPLFRRRTALRPCDILHNNCHLYGDDRPVRDPGLVL